MANERKQSMVSRLACALMRRVFKNCQGKSVNKISRQMTPEEAVDFYEEMAARARRAKRKGSSVNEVMDKTQS